MQNVRPAAANGGHRDILISGFRPHQKNSLKAFFTATLPSGMVLHDLMLHERNGVRFTGFPARERTDQGERQTARFRLRRAPRMRNPLRISPHRSN